MDKNYAFDVLTADNLAAWTNAIQKVCSGLNKLNLKSVIQDTSSSVIIKCRSNSYPHFYGLINYTMLFIMIYPRMALSQIHLQAAVQL